MTHALCNTVSKRRKGVVQVRLIAGANDVSNILIFSFNINLRFILLIKLILI